MLQEVYYRPLGFEKEITGDAVNREKNQAKKSRRVDIGVDEAAKTREKKRREPLQRKGSRWVDIG